MSFPRQFFLLTLLCAGSINAAFAQKSADEAATKLNAALLPFVEEGEVPGLVAVVGNQDGIVAESVLGSQNVALKQPMKKDSLFRIASMTKPVVAIGIMILQDEGKLSVEDDVEQHLPEFKGLQLAEQKDGKTTLRAPSRPIKIRDLLTHTSGMPAGYPGEMKNLYFDREHTLAEATAVAAKQPLQFEPGSKWSYCNAGIDTLGRIIEVKSGKSFEDFLQERVFKPLKMVDTTPYPSEEQLQRLAGLYDRKEGRLTFVDYALLGPVKGAKHPIPAGGLYSTAADLARLYQMMLHGGGLDGQRIISEKAAKQMTSLQTGDLKTGFTDGMGWGFGWQFTREPQGVHATASKGTYGHGGAFGTQGWIDPEKKLFVILLIQRTGLANADASPLRKALQDAAVTIVK
ncbi:serine hydrolase domain-containing protein [Anatilimnocola floriformis]|uniref:serine hydrolase domain-containing protein n=1 Tax=Anatilimnocola floriformis TaxID=2948575 RepID=UPI0020C2FEF0|nr:serine hydrolase domain-containing protein [Anatilimnocola floriformis]